MDSTVLALKFDLNNKISVLPVRVDETFPVLAAYFAQYCSIKTISKVNFKNLKKLRVLALTNNKIERIDDDTFEDLTSLEQLGLGSCFRFLTFA